MNWYKIASRTGFVDIMPDKQKMSSGALFDIQRYGFDSYVIRTQINQADDQISVTIYLTHGDLGNTVYADFWYYKTDELEIAKKTYAKLNDIVEDLLNEFAQERMPTTMLWAFTKARTQFLDKEHAAYIQIPWVRYSRDIPIEPDWRKNLYGNRYPKYTEHSNKEEYMIRKNIFFD